MSLLDVTRTYLEMRSPSDLVDATASHPEAQIRRVGFCPAAFFRYLYVEVGRAYRWTDRLRWSDSQIRAYLDAGDVSLHVLYLDGAPGGYFELRRHADRSIEVAYFGLMADYIGRGLGSWLLAQATRAAWEEKPERVRLHTSTLDHPHALPHYLRRGFQVVRTEVYQLEAVP